MNEKERVIMEQALEALKKQQEALKVWPDYLIAPHEYAAIDAAEKAITALRAVLSQEKIEPAQEKVSKMTVRRAVYFMERFKREEKLLGPNEQAALDFVISMLERQEQDESGQEPVEPVAWNWMLDGQPYGQAYYGRPPDADIVETLRLREDRAVRLLYTAPPQRTMVPLTEGEIEQIRKHELKHGDIETFARAIERASLEKNK